MYKYHEEALPVIVFLCFIFAIVVSIDYAFAVDIVRTQKSIQFKGYDRGRFFIAVQVEGEVIQVTITDVEQFNRMEIGQQIDLSYRDGKLFNYNHEIMETN